MSSRIPKIPHRHTRKKRFHGAHKLVLEILALLKNLQKQVEELGQAIRKQAGAKQVGATDGQEEQTLAEGPDARAVDKALGEPQALEEHNGRGRQLPLHRDLSLIGTLLTILISIFTVGRVSIWLVSMSTATVVQSRIERVNMLINQTYETLGRDLDDTPLCVLRNGYQLTFVICKNQQVVAVDEFELCEDPAACYDALEVLAPIESGDRMVASLYYDEDAPKVLAVGRGAADSEARILKLRRYYDEAGTRVIAVDRYEYADSVNMNKILRVTYQKILGVYNCAYSESAIGPRGVYLQSSFNGACGDLSEVPTYAFLRASPPPMVLFMPYR